MGKRRTKVVESSLPQFVPEPISPERINLGAMLSEKKPPLQRFLLWLIGDTPLICHAWSHKAKLEMLRKQVGATASGKEKRDPEQDFIDSLYEMTERVYGFPVTAVKKAILACAHKDRGVAKTDVMAALQLDAEIVKTRPALADANCDMPLVRIYGSDPVMREDMVRIGAGARRTANLAYRAQFTTWAMRVTGGFNPLILQSHQVIFLTRTAGTAIGIGDWRNEKAGWAGAFHIGDLNEQTQWEKFIAGNGPLPQPAPMSEAAE